MKTVALRWVLVVAAEPECLQPLTSVDNVRFAAVEVTVEGSTWRPVVWIDCTSVRR